MHERLLIPHRGSIIGPVLMKPGIEEDDPCMVVRRRGCGDKNTGKTRAQVSLVYVHPRTRVNPMLHGEFSTWKLSCLIFCHQTSAKSVSSALDSPIVKKCFVISWTLSHAHAECVCHAITLIRLVQDKICSDKKKSYCACVCFYRWEGVQTLPPQLRPLLCFSKIGKIYKFRVGPSTGRKMGHRFGVCLHRRVQKIFVL